MLHSLSPQFKSMKSANLCPAVAAVLTLCLQSCSIVDYINPQPPGNAADPAAVVPGEFLLTRYQPLNTWLDEAVRVQIIDVPLSDVFNHPALRGLEYVIVKAPPVNPLITIDKLALTRRQLLWVLAQDYQLHMTPSFGPHGEVRFIEIRSRSVDLPNA